MCVEIEPYAIFVRYIFCTYFASATVYEKYCEIEFRKKSKQRFVEIVGRQKTRNFPTLG